ncbi:hypothetical protein E0Z10_g11005, partial [Xylaria hypoxylon]
MSRKSVLSAVCASNGAFEATAMRMTGLQRRRFTSTPQRNMNITHFTPTSSAALDSLLSEIRTKIILPSYLPMSQRKRIYSSKWEKKLQADPIIIEIDGEVLKFRYQNLLTDVPSTRKSVLAAVSQFETDADFANLKPLLEGVHYAGRKLQHSVYAKILRVVGIKGHIYDIIDCARSVRRTGYKLESSEKVNELLHFVQMKARNADWDEAETRQALRWAEMVVEMLHEEVHQPERHKDEPLLPGEMPLTRDPMVLAAPLHLAAVLVVRHEAGEDVVDKVHKLARDVVALWPEGKKLKELQPAELYADYDKMGYLVSANRFVALATPLLHGLETAAKVVKPELASQLQTRCDTLVAEIKEARILVAETKKARILAAEIDEALVPPKRSEDVYNKFYDASSPPLPYLCQDDVLLEMLRDRAEEVLALKPLPREQAIRISVRAIAEHRNDSMTRTHELSDLLRRDDVQRAAGAQVYALLVQAPVHHLDALLVRDVQAAIQERRSGARLSVMRPWPMPSVMLPPLRSASFPPDWMYECRTDP